MTIKKQKVKTGWKVTATHVIGNITYLSTGYGVNLHAAYCNAINGIVK